MKKFLLILAMAGIFAVGCQTDNTTGIVGGNGEVTQLTVALPNTPDTKIALGEKVDGKYRVHWSEGDCIAVNGVKSKEIIISEENPSNATFIFSTATNYPLNITYPYISTTTAEAPKVELPTEQQYTENTFEVGAAPMCGYVEGNNSAITLTHLSGVLRFPVVASTEGTVLQKIVITSLDGAKLSGEFDVNCSAKTLVASENAESYISYNLPDNFTLSTSEESVFYITIPAGKTGTCKVEFVESSGEKMILSWSDKDIKAGIVREFKTITYKRGTTGSLEPFQSEEDEFDTPEVFSPTVYGYVKDSNGNPIEGVAVSDGFQVVTTNQHGYYMMDNVTKDTWYIYISVPSEYEIPINNYGQPCFYKKYPSSSPRFDFTLTPLAGGKEEKFALLTFADPQVLNQASLERFRNESIPSIKEHVAELSETLPCYGITLGDIIWNNYGRNIHSMRYDMRESFSVSSVGMPVFQVMGNHDHVFFGSGTILTPDERSSSWQLKAQREHEAVFGPINYSFNRGDVHIIGMLNIQFTDQETPSTFSGGFSDAQYEWLQQDLALVPKDKMVVLCVHQRMLKNSTNHRGEVLALLNSYKEAHILSGHSHIQWNYEHCYEGSSYTNVYEHITSAVCGNFWTSNLAADGSPNGYNVFIGDGNTFSNWYYMGCNDQMNTKNHQMRLYRGNAISGAEIEGDNEYDTKGYYAFNFGDDVLLANVYNADNEWTITVYENGKPTGTMERIETIDLRDKAEAKEDDEFTTIEDYLTGSYTQDDPRRFNTECDYDMYVQGLLMGKLGRAITANGSFTVCRHMYKYQLKDKTATIKVVATDRFNNRYEETKITDCTDFSIVY